MDRRGFIGCAASVPLAVVGSRLVSPFGSTCTGVRVEEDGGDTAARGRPGPGLSREGTPAEARADPDTITLFLCGDVMTGRGLDQILPHPGDPRLHEPYARSASRYVELAEAENGPIPAPVDYSYPWGDALVELDRVAPDARIINLETAVTTSDRQWRGKGIHYRMHPGNLPCIAAAAVDCCVLANNHVIDWGFSGLRETLEVLKTAGIETAGAGLDAEEAATPATAEVGGGRRVLVFGFGTETSGIPRDWAARADRPGVNLLDDLSPSTVGRIADRLGGVKSEGSVVVASIHWGSNWGYTVPAAQREFAHRLIEEAGLDVVHGHSSHHFKGIEVHRGRPVLYGCGDFLNDYEGISGREEYRSDLALLYFPVIDSSTGRLSRLSLLPMRMRRFRLNRASKDDVEWVRDTLNREGERFGTWVEAGSAGDLELRWT
jgi:poly-gamma-glutamate synthesis protein (capsule biosynthesis protein)